MQTGAGPVQGHGVHDTTSLETERERERETDRQTETEREREREREIREIREPA